MVNFVATTSWIRGKMCKIFHHAKSVKTVLLSGTPPSMMRDVSRYSDLPRQHTKELYVGITPDRTSNGWPIPDLSNANLAFAGTACRLISCLNADSIPGGTNPQPET
jgi:hypothetical protein